MTAPSEPDLPPDLADRVDRALEALWRGDSTQFDRLLKSDDVSGPGVGELLEGVIGEHAESVRGVPREFEVDGYRIIAEIGRGGMGVVYKARQLCTKRIVALKVMLAGPFASESGRRRFQREIELAARFQHSGIVRVLESGEVSTGQPYFAMDYVEGVPLDQWVAASQPDVPTILCLLRELCEAVDYAHQHDVIHRDLKPGNVLIDDSGKPHILDFGLAKAADHVDTEGSLTTFASSPGQVVGTLRYLSPEQAAGTPEDIDARTDVYALGVMLFETLTGSLPFDTTGRPSEVTRRILEEPPTPPSSLSNRVDGELETIILKALEKEKIRRYQSAQDMGEDLRRYLDGEPILAKRPSATYVLRKKLARHRTGCALAAVCVVLALGTTLRALWVKQHELSEARRAILRTLHNLEAGRSDASAIGRAGALHLEWHARLPEATLLVAQAQFRVGWQQQGNVEQRDSAVRTLKEASTRAPSLRWACQALLAEIYRSTGNPHWEQEQAQANHNAPDTAEAWYLRTFTTFDIEQAERYAKEAVERNPKHALAWERLAYLYLQTERFDNASGAAQKLFELGEAPADWLLFQGHVLLKQARYSEAVTQYTRVTTLAPPDYEPYRQRGVAHLCMEEYEEATKDYSKAVETRTPVAIWEHYFAATPLWMTGQRNKAAEHLRAFLSRTDYGCADAQLFLILRDQAGLLQNQGRMADATKTIEDADEALEAGRGRATPGTWAANILECLAGRLAPEKLVAVAGQDAGGKERQHVCEGYYYSGEACLLRGRKAKGSGRPDEAQRWFHEAREWFQKCVDNDLRLDPDTWPPDPMNEYHLALWRLESLRPNDNIAP